MNDTLAVASSLILGVFPDDELAALNNVITGFGHIPPENIAFERAVGAYLVKDNGYPADRESLEAALSMEISNRPAFDLLRRSGEDRAAKADQKDEVYGIMTGKTDFAVPVASNKAIFDGRCSDR